MTLMMTVERMLNTVEMAYCLALESPTSALKRCAAGKFPGARQTGPRGHWKISAEDMRAYLVANGIPTDRLERLLKTP
jgi:hypothetical protein